VQGFGGVQGCFDIKGHAYFPKAYIQILTGIVNHYKISIEDLRILQYLIAQHIFQLILFKTYRSLND